MRSQVQTGAAGAGGVGYDDEATGVGLAEQQEPLLAASQKPPRSQHSLGHRPPRRYQIHPLRVPVQ